MRSRAEYQVLWDQEFTDLEVSMAEEAESEREERGGERGNGAETGH